MLSPLISSFPLIFLRPPHLHNTPNPAHATNQTYADFDPGDSRSSNDTSQPAAAALHAGKVGSPAAAPRRRIVGTNDDDVDDMCADEDNAAAANFADEDNAAAANFADSMAEDAPAKSMFARGGTTEDAEAAKRAKFLSRPALLALRLGKEGTWRKREQQERKIEGLPDMESDDWRRAGGKAVGRPGGIGSNGKVSSGRTAGFKRRKLLSSKSGITDEPVAFGLESLVFVTAPANSEPPRLPRSTRAKHLLTRPPMLGNSLSLLTATGSMVYLRTAKATVGTKDNGERTDEGNVDATLPLGSRLAKLHGDVAAVRLDGGAGGLLSLPMHELMKKVEHRRYARSRTSQILLQARLQNADSATMRLREEKVREEKDEDKEEGGGKKKQEEQEEQDGEEEQEREEETEEKEEEEDMGTNGSGEAARTLQNMAPAPRPEQLWVNRYSPSAFPHLLSDEATNREVLRLLRSWDEFVFKRAVPKTLAEAPAQPAWKTNWNNKNNNQDKDRGSNQQQHRNGGGTGSNPMLTPRERASMDAEREAAAVQRRDKRPKEQARAILLCGPPGMGKTTLAHVVAAHCGYRPLEFNASDDRSAAVLQEKITRAMQNQAVLGDKRPNCIILDEADGIDGKTGIKMIVDMIKAPLKSDAAGGKKKSGGDGSASVPALTRPLICICNDLYAPQLRPLRDVATVFRFRKTSSTRLLQRLKTICLAESLPLESTALGALCEAAGNDVRSCLNTLQFFKSRVPQPTGGEAAGGVGQAARASALSRQLMQHIGAGLKDQEKDMLQVCNAIFRKPQAKTSATATATVLLLPGEEEEEEATRRDGQPYSSSSSPSHRKQRDTDMVISTVAAFSDHGQVLQAAHENFCQMRYTDPNLTKTALAAEWLAFSDLIHGRQLEGRCHLMEDLHLATAAAIHLLCRVEVRPRITLPRKDYEFRSARLSRQHILQSFTEGCVLQALWARHPAAIVLDVVSPLVHILNPSLRPINPDLYSFAEKAMLRQLVGVMMACGVSFMHTNRAGLYSHQQGAHDPLEMVPMLVHLAEFGLSNDGSGAPKDEALPVQRPRPARVLPTFVKLLATQEAKLEVMKQAECRKADAIKARHGGVLPTALNKKAERPGHALPSFSTPSPADTKKPRFGAANLSAKLLMPDMKEEPTHKTWFVKLGTKRSTSKAKPSISYNDRLDALQQQGQDGGSHHSGEARQQPATNKATIRFKYVAGYTNAVRRPVCMKDML